MNEEQPISISFVTNQSGETPDFMGGLLINFTMAEVRFRHGVDFSSVGPEECSICLTAVLKRFGTYLLTDEAREHIVVTVRKELGFGEQS